MVKLTKDPEVIKRWNSMTIQEQISNIGSEVLRADRWKQESISEDQNKIENQTSLVLWPPTA